MYNKFRQNKTNVREISSKYSKFCEILYFREIGIGMFVSALGGNLFVADCLKKDQIKRWRFPRA